MKCSYCNKSPDIEYTKLIRCFVCSKVFCQNCFVEDLHNNIKDMKLTKRYTILYNDEVEQIIKYKCELFILTRQRIENNVNFEDFDEGFEANACDINWKFRRSTMQFRGDHNKFQKELKYIKERFYYEYVKMVLQKRLCNDLVECVLSLL